MLAKASDQSHQAVIGLDLIRGENSRMSATTEPTGYSQDATGLKAKTQNFLEMSDASWTIPRVI